MYHGTVVPQMATLASLRPLPSWLLLAHLKAAEQQTDCAPADDQQRNTETRRPLKQTTLLQNVLPF